jgi:hypothetical protein
MRAISCVCFLLLLAVPVDAQGWEVGLRLNVVTAGGEPANDIMSTGVFVRRELSDRWAVLVSVDQAEYDFERPAATLDLEQDPDVEVIDTTTESMIAAVSLERAFGMGGGPSTWFLGGGVGFASPDVDDVQGPLAAGGTFNIETDAGTEIIASLYAGVRRSLLTHLTVEFALRADHHFAEWDVHDLVSGREATLNDYTGLGAHLGLGLRF